MATKTAAKNGTVNRIEDKLPKVIATPVKIIPLRQKTIRLKLVGTSPYMQARFSEKALHKMMATQQAGSQAKSKRAREARDFDSDYEAATHFLEDGNAGIPASAFRNAAISACKLVGFHMTKAKCTIFVEADGLDRIDGTPLVVIHGKREKTVMPARNDNGSCDLRSRPMWRKWSTTIAVRFDEDQFSVSDVVNLIVRVGAQVGVGEGRPDSPNSNGLGYGLFDVQFAEDKQGEN